MDDNQEFAWNIKEIAARAGLHKSAEEVAIIVGIFFKRLTHDGMTRDEAAELSHTFLASYIDGIFSNGRNKAQGE